jgi:cell division protease FtsH
MGVLLLQGLWAPSQEVANIPYSQFLGLVRAGDVEKVTIGPDRIEGSLKKPLEGKSRFVTTRVDPDISTDLDAAGVTSAGRLESNFLGMLLSWVLPVLFFFGVWMFLARRMQGAGGPGSGLMAIGKSKAKVYVETDTRTSFADVAGVDEAKAELAEVVAFLKDPRSYGRLGARMPKGVLLVGPPGTGKTLLVEGARRLLENETLSDGELAELLGRVKRELPRAA